MSRSANRPRAHEAPTRLSSHGDAVTPTGRRRVEVSSVRMTAINPAMLGAPTGWTHGWLAPANARLLFVAGQTAADADGRVGDRDFAAQFESALRKSLLVVTAAGGAPEHVVRMTVYVTDLDAYRESRKAIGDAWRRHMGRHYPAMALVEVSRLVDAEAVIEIEVTAAVPPTPEEIRG